MRLFQRIARKIRGSAARPGEEEVGYRGSGRTSEFLSPWTRYASRRRLWEDLHTMDQEEPIVARGLDHIAGLVTTSDDGSISGFRLEGEQRELSILEPLVAASDLQDLSFDLVRSMVLYGDHFLELIASEDMTIARVKQFPYSYQIVVNWDKHGNLCAGDPENALKGHTSSNEEPPAYVQTDDVGKVVAAFYPYQIVQMSFGTKSGLPYAEPLLACVTRGWKRLRAKEDGLAQARLTRAYTQRVHHIPVPIGSTGKELGDRIQMYRQGMSSDLLVPYDASNTQFEMTRRHIPPNVDTDLYVPRFYTPDGSRVIDTDVSNLVADNPYLTDIADIELDLRRLICAITVPSRYLNLDIGPKAFVDRGTEEAREAFAYFLMRVGKSYRRALKQIFDLQLLLHGVNPLTAKYEIILPRSLPPSATQTAARVENLRSQTAIMWTKLGIPQEIIGKHVLRLSNKELEQWSRAASAAPTNSSLRAQFMSWLEQTGGELPPSAVDAWAEEARRQLSGGHA